MLTLTVINDKRYDEHVTRSTTGRPRFGPSLCQQIDPIGSVADLGGLSGVDVGGDASSECGEASAVVRHGGRVELESLG